MKIKPGALTDMYDGNRPCVCACVYVHVCMCVWDDQSQPWLVGQINTGTLVWTYRFPGVPGKLWNLKCCVTLTICEQIHIQDLNWVKLHSKLAGPHTLRVSWIYRPLEEQFLMCYCGIFKIYRALFDNWILMGVNDGTLIVKNMGGVVQGMAFVSMWRNAETF